jgi:thymidylate synthase (FAD)
MSVELLHVMGNDLMVVNAARVSFAKESLEFSMSDEKLIRYLARHHHESPFFHPQIQFRIKMPLFVAREWYRHQVGFARNEVSRRYVDTPPECWVPSAQDVRERDERKKQGSKDTSVQNPQVCVDMMTSVVNKSVATYHSLLEQGVAPEIARTILPQSMYTEFVETGSLAGYARLYKLRIGPDAQREIREYAHQIGTILAEKFPVAWDALTEA